jgi:transposase
MKRAVDWAAVEQQLAVYYAAEGRPSWPPAVLVRMLVLEEFADLSDRQVSEQVAYNLLYRAFVGLDMDETVPDDTTLVTFRSRLGTEGVREIFELLNARWRQQGLIGDEHRVLDGSHIWAKVARRSWVSLLRRGRALVVEAVAGMDGARAEELAKRFVPDAKEKEERGEEALRAEQKQTGELLEAVKDLQDARVQERAQLLRSMLGEKDRPVSFEDPDARWGHKREDFAFLGYKTHEAMDPESRMITSVDVLPGNANEAVRTDELVKQEKSVVAGGATLIGDGLYNNVTTVAQVEASGGQACFSGLHAQRISDNFGYEGDADRMVCGQGKHSIGKIRVNNGDMYYFSMHDCAECQLKDRCLTPGERKGKAMARRRVYLSDVRKRKVLAGETGRAWRREKLRLRGRIESKFDEQMNRHGLRRARYWGLAKMTMQVLLNVIAVNLKRAVKLIHMEGSGPPRAALASAGGA